MIKCNTCDTEYEDIATYCNNCDIDLIEPKPENKQNKPQNLRNRFVGIIALVIGLAISAALVINPSEANLKVILAAFIFTIIGGWQFYTEKGLASITEFIFKGNLQNDSHKN